MTYRRSLGVLTAVFALIVTLLGASPAMAAGSASITGTIDGSGVTLTSITATALSTSGNVVGSSKVQPGGEFTIAKLPLAKTRLRFSATVDGQEVAWYWTGGVNDDPVHGTVVVREAKLIRLDTRQNGYVDETPQTIRFGTVEGQTAKSDGGTGGGFRVHIAAKSDAPNRNDEIKSFGAYYRRNVAIGATGRYSIKFLPYRNNYRIKYVDQIGAAGSSYQSDWWHPDVAVGGREKVGDSATFPLLTDKQDRPLFTFKRMFDITGNVTVTDGTKNGKGGYKAEKDRDGKWIATKVSPTHRVELLDKADNYRVVTSATVNSTGRFRLRGARFGVDYIVRFGGIAGKSRFAAEYYCQTSACKAPTGKAYDPQRSRAEVIKRASSATNFTDLGLKVVTLNKAKQITGYVRKSKTGYPRRRITVEAYSADKKYVSRHAYTDKNGKFAIKGLPPASYYVVVNPDGFVGLTSRRYYNGKKGGAATTSKKKTVNTRKGSRKIGTLYFNAMPFSAKNPNEAD